MSTLLVELLLFSESTVENESFFLGSQVTPKMPSSHPNDALRHARRALAQGRAAAALEWLTELIAFPNCPSSLPDEAVELLTEAIGPLFPKSQVALELLSHNPSSPEALLLSGQALLEDNFEAFAATLLQQALQLAPSFEHHESYLRALGALGEYRRAAQVAASTPPMLQRHFAMRFSHAFYSGLAGDLGPARADMSWLRDHAGHEEEAQQVELIETWVKRAEALGFASTEPDFGDLQSWQALLFGSVVISQSSTNGRDTAGRRRFACRQESAAELRHKLIQLRDFLSALDLLPQQIYWLPQRRDQIIARAAAELWAVEASPWLPARRRPGLVISWTLRSLEPRECGELKQVFAEEILYEHNTSWTLSSSIAGDISSGLYQHLEPLWDPHEETPIGRAVDRILRAPSLAQDRAGFDEAVIISMLAGELGGPLRVRGERQQRRPWGMR